MAETLRVGIIGSGWAAGAHAIGYSRLPDVAVTGIWSRTRANAETLAGKLAPAPIKVYDHWEDLIERGELDAISIAAAPPLRMDPFAAALKRGLHVLMEKPSANNLAEAQAMLDLAERAGTLTAVCLNWRYSPGCQTAWRAVQEGQIGRLRDVRIQNRRDRPILDPIRPWVYIPEIGGTLREGGYHHLDRLRFIAGAEIDRIVARLVPPVGLEPPTDHPEYIIDESYSILTQMSNGGEGSISFAATPGQSERVFVMLGDKGTLVVQGDARVYMQRAGDKSPVELESLQVDSDAIEAPFPELIQHTWSRLVADFVAAIRTGDVRHASVPHLATLVDGLRIEEAIAAARRSQVEWRWVSPAEAA